MEAQDSRKQRINHTVFFVTRHPGARDATATSGRRWFVQLAMLVLSATLIFFRTRKAPT